MPKVRTRRSEPEDDGGGECDGGEEGVCAPVVACCDAPPILEATEYVLDAVTASVTALVVFDGRILGYTKRGFSCLR